MKNKLSLVVLVLAVIMISAQLIPGMLQRTNADLQDMDAVYTFVQKEIMDVPRDTFDTWETYYLDVTNDGVDELVLVSPYGQHWHPHMEVLRVVDGRFQRIAGEIYMTKNASVPDVRDGFLTVRNYGSGSGLSFTDLDLYLYDGTSMLSLASLTLFRSDPGGEVTGELHGPLTDFRHTLMDIDPLRPNPVIVKGAYHYRFDPESNRFEVEKLVNPIEVFDYTDMYIEVNQTYQFDLDGSGTQDIFRLESSEDTRFVINEDVFHLPEVPAPYLHIHYDLIPIEFGDNFAFVLYVFPTAPETYYETHFYQYTGTEGLSLVGKVYSDELLYGSPFIHLYVSVI